MYIYIYYVYIYILYMLDYICTYIMCTYTVCIRHVDQVCPLTNMIDIPYRVK